MKKILFRLIFSIGILLIITLVTFKLMDLHTSKAEETALKKVGVSIAEFEEQKKALGYNDSFLQRYTRWLKGTLHGNLGMYYDHQIQVESYLPKFAGRTLLLNIVAFFVSIAIAIPIGVYSAMKNQKIQDTLILILTIVLTSVPSFYFGLLLILCIARQFPGLLPISGMGSTIYVAKGYPDLVTQIFDVAHHMLLPVLCISLVWIGTLVPHIRHAMLEVIHQDYIRTAKAKGLKQSHIFFKHMLRNAMLPIISITCLLIPTLIISNILVEKIFSWPGLGMLFIESVYRGERNIIMAIILIYALLVIIGNTLSEFLYKKADKRLEARL